MSNEDQDSPRGNEDDMTVTRNDVLLIKRLRRLYNNWSLHGGPEPEIYIEAADEIERLRDALLDCAQGTNEKWTHDRALRALYPDRALT